MEVSKALRHVYNNVDTDNQWSRAITCLRAMSHLQVAQAWKEIAHSCQHGDNPVIVLSQYKMLFKRALKEAEPHIPTASIDDAVVLLRQYHQALISLRAFISIHEQTRNQTAYNESNEYVIPVDEGGTPSPRTVQEIKSVLRGFETKITEMTARSLKAIINIETAHTAITETITRTETKLIATDAQILQFKTDMTASLARVVEAMHAQATRSQEILGPLKNEIQQSDARFNQLDTRLNEIHTEMKLRAKRTDDAFTEFAKDWSDLAGELNQMAQVLTIKMETTEQTIKTTRAIVEQLQVDLAKTKREMHTHLMPSSDLPPTEEPPVPPQAAPPNKPSMVDESSLPPQKIIVENLNQGRKVRAHSIQGPRRIAPGDPPYAEAADPKHRGRISKTEQDGEAKGHAPWAHPRPARPADTVPARPGPPRPGSAVTRPSGSAS